MLGGLSLLPDLEKRDTMSPSSQIPLPRPSGSPVPLVSNLLLVLTLRGIFSAALLVPGGENILNPPPRDQAKETDLALRPPINEILKVLDRLLKTDIDSPNPLCLRTCLFHRAWLTDCA